MIDREFDRIGISMGMSQGACKGLLDSIELLRQEYPDVPPHVLMEIAMEVVVSIAISMIGSLHESWQDDHRIDDAVRNDVAQRISVALAEMIGSKLQGADCIEWVKNA